MLVVSLHQIREENGIPEGPVCVNIDLSRRLHTRLPRERSTQTLDHALDEKIAVLDIDMDVFGH